MKIKPNIYLKAIFNLFGSILLFTQFTTVNYAHSFGLTLEGKTEFAGIPSGIIRDIQVIENAAYIASENGVFRLLGGYSEVVEYKGDLEEHGTISDLFYGSENTLWIVEYGVGVFSVDLETGEHTKHYDNEKWTKYAWKLVELESYLIISLIQGVLVVDKATGKIQNWAKDIGVNKVDKVFTVTSPYENFVYLSSDRGLIRINYSTLTTEIISVSELSPYLTSVDAVSISKGVLQLAGKDGLLLIELSTGKKSFYPFEDGQVSQYRIADIFTTKNERVLVAAGGLFEVEEGKLKVPQFMSPLLNSEGIRSIVKIDEVSSGELLLASSQLGLIPLTKTQKAINFIHENETVLRKNIQKFGFSLKSELLVKTRQNRYILDLNTGALNKSNPTNLKDGNCVDYRAMEVQAIYRDKEPELSYCDLDYTNQISLSSTEYLAYQDNGKTAFFDLVRDGSIIDRIPAPRFLVRSFVTQSGEIIGFDSQNSVHIQLSKFNWKTISPNDGGWNGITCLFESQELFYVCTAGQGIKAIAKSTWEIKHSEILSTNEVRFIRGGLQTSNGNLWFITNKGLYLVADNKDVFFLGTAEGIFDTDFEYGGIFSAKDKLVVLGDKYSYLIDEKLALSSLYFKYSKQSNVIIVETLWKDANGNESRSHPFVTNKREELVLPNNFRDLRIEFRTNSFSNFKVENLEFRIIGIDESWKQHPRSHAWLSVSDIDSGDYEFQARIKGYGSPITTLKFKVERPFILSNIAIIFYLIFLLIVYGALKSKILQNMWIEFKSTKLYANLTRYEITDGQSKFEKMLRSKERFIDEVTTELRTPIQVIKGSLDDLSNSRKENSKQLICIQENMRRVEQLVEHMRSGAPQAEKVANYYKLYSPEDIKFIANSLATLAKPKRQNLEVKLRGKKSVSLVNDSLEKILTHLIQNAVKFTPAQGNIKVTITIDSKTLKIIVSDDGVGINEQILKRIFERFIKEHEQEEGEGIGLAVVKNLIELNQGTISVESKKGEGSKFSILLPVDDIEFVNSNAEIIDSTNQTSTRKTLLIVDNSREFRTYMFDLLSKKYRCLVAKNGQQALEVMQHFLVDLVITEQIMPIMDGITLTKEIRSQVNHMNTPVLMLSAKTDPELEKSALESKVDYFLPKPASNEEILLRVEHLLAVRETQGRDGQISAKPNFEFVCLDIPEFTNEKDMAFYLNFIAVLEKNYHKENFNRNQAAEQLLMSTRSLNRRLSELFDYNFSEFLSRYRIEKSIPLLLEGRTILDACLDVGYGTAAYFSTSFKKIMKMPPKRFVEQYNEKHGGKPYAKS